jgi:hypothetical protein
MATVTVRLPDDLAQQAKAAGLLRDEAIEKQRVDRFFASVERLNALEPRLTEEEIRTEIEAARDERRDARDARRS